MTRVVSTLRGPRPRTLVAGLVLALITTAGATGMASAASSAPERAIRYASSPTAVSGSYLVVLKDKTLPVSAVRSSATDLAGRFGGDAKETWSGALKGFHLTGTATQARRVAADPRVAYVEQDQVFGIDTTQSSPPWGLDRIDQRNRPLSASYTYTGTASNVRVYVIDTGIRFSHNQFGGRATSGYDAVDGGSADDCNGHGTHVAGTVGGSTYGVAKSVRLVAVRVLNCSGSGTTTGVVNGINWVANNRVLPAAANMSLGGGASTAIDNAVTNAVNNRGVTFAVAAGNETTNACNRSPARVPAAITTGATSNTDAKPSWSNYGSCLDVFAPGVSVLSSYYTSNTASATLSGTSMASPHVAGVAALVLGANPSYTPAQVSSWIVSNATTGVVTSAGTGSPNRLLYKAGL
ncbi:S8 family peptidase [Flindersiella endophytica]